MTKPIFVIGSSNTDMVVKVQNLPIPGETVVGGDFLMNPGGKGANQAVAAARLGGTVSFVARIGNDLFGKIALQQFEREHIAVDFVTVDDDHPSGVALIPVDEKGENCVIVAPGSNGHLDKKQISAALTSIRQPAVILLQMEIPGETVEYALAEGHRNGNILILNPAPARRLAEASYRFIYLITPNESEAEMLTGIHVTDEATARAAASVLHARGVPNVVITMGAKGAFLSDSRVQKMIPAKQVHAIDTTAAGDCFNGAIAVALAEGENLESAATFACRAAAISVTRMGAQASMPTRMEIK